MQYNCNVCHWHREFLNNTVLYLTVERMINGPHTTSLVQVSLPSVKISFLYNVLPVYLMGNVSCFKVLSFSIHMLYPLSIMLCPIYFTVSTTLCTYIKKTTQIKKFNLNQDHGIYLMYYRCSSKDRKTQRACVNTYCLQILIKIQYYWLRTNYRNFFLVLVRLFLCSPIHPFKRLMILNVTNRLTLGRNIIMFMRMLVSGTHCKVVDFCHRIVRESTNYRHLVRCGKIYI